MTTNTSIDSTRAPTRRALRARRRTLERSARRHAERAIARNLLRSRPYRRARAIAVYFGIDGEADIGQVIEHARASGKAIFAPVLAGTALAFVEIGDRSVFARNRFGIIEPSSGKRIDPRKLDVVLTPLVAYDSRGNRLGMGKGYYDRSFRFLRLRSHWLKPKLIGVGFGFQKLESLTAQDWDVPLWGAATDVGVDYFEEFANR